MSLITENVTTAALLSSIQKGALAITANRRISTFLHSALQTKGQFSEEHCQNVILSLNDWLEKIWQQHLHITQFSSYHLLLPLSQEIIWEKIITESKAGSHLLRVGGTAQSAMMAWNIMRQWNIPFTQLQDFQSSEDIAAFTQWSRQYQIKCSTRKWMDQGEILKSLIQYPKEYQNFLNTELILVGFEEYTPLFKYFLENLQLNNYTISSVALIPEQGNQTCYRVRAKRSEEEFLYAGQWSVDCLQKMKNADIHIVVPKLDTMRFEVTRVLRENFADLTINIAAPLPLLDYPMIKTACTFLKILKSTIEIEDLTYFLHSPFLGQKEYTQRAALAAIMHQCGENRWQASDLLLQIDNISAQKPYAYCPNFIAALKANFKIRVQGKKSLVVWSEIFQTVLKTIHWPGDRALNSQEYQLRQAFENSLKEYAKLQHIVSDLYCSEAIDRLLYLLQRTLFLPSEKRGQVQVLTVLEAAGLPADYRWITGMQQEDWPASPSPNPFIPLPIQKKYGVPHSSAERERLMTKRFIHTLREGSQHTMFSSAKIIDTQSSKSSALIKEIPKLNDIHLLIKRPTTFWENIVNKREEVFRDEIIETPNIPLLAEEKIKGGARILQLQAVCPFRAFAEIRLQAKSKMPSMLGLTPIERGEIVHQVLNRFWEPLVDQSALLSLSKEQLEMSIKKAVSDTLHYWQKRRPSILKSRYLMMEQHRLETILYRWIDIEKSRPAFTVESHEKAYQIKFNTLDLSIRIDRIDRLDNGSLILIDYKTGNCNIQDWFGERPAAPQLPLYSILLDPTPIAIAFAILRKDKIQFEGVAQQEQILPLLKKITDLSHFGACDDWSLQTFAWKEILEKLAEDFVKGVTKIDPKEGYRTCQKCHLGSLCRVQELK